MRERAILALEDGSCYPGYSFGAAVDSEGEVVFATPMTGYQEVCTDASYRGQMVVLTYPIIGNYGVTAGDSESVLPWLAALIVREYSPDYSNWRAEADLHTYLAEHGVPGVYGVDTRALTRHLRTFGTMRGVLLRDPGNATREELTARARRVRPIIEKPVVDETATTSAYEFTQGTAGSGLGDGKRIVVVDCGVKHSILRSLRERGAEVHVVPYRSRVQHILALHPNGVLYSNGAGDPMGIPEVATSMRALMEIGTPLLGICMGHHMLATAVGAKTLRLKFGHHGGNHPVKDLATGRVYITTQNHEYATDPSSIPPSSGVTISHINLNDHSVEGLAHVSKPIFSVQYHPEGSPGPQDNQYVFDRFLGMLRRAGD